MPHTQGPWYVEHPYGEDGIYIAAKKSIGLVVKLYMADGEYDFKEKKWKGQSDETEHNATLIASAPELLEVAKLTLRNINSLIFHVSPTLSNVELQSLERWAEFVEKAIAKAEGRS